MATGEVPEPLDTYGYPHSHALYSSDAVEEEKVADWKLMKNTLHPRCHIQSVGKKRAAREKTKH